MLEKEPKDQPMLELPLTPADYALRLRVPSNARFAFQRAMEAKYPGESKLRGEWEEMYKDWAKAKPE